MQRLADLTFHFGEAGLPNRGVPYALASGAQALATSAAVEAMAYYRTALRLLGAAGEASARATALGGLGDAATLAGDYTQAATAYRTAQALWLDMGDSAAAARAWLGLGKVRRRQEAVTEARTAFEQALALVGSHESADAAETLLQLGDLYVTTLSQQAQGLAYIERALGIIERSTGAPWGRRLEARAYCVLGNAQARANDLVAGRNYLERAHTLALALDDPELAAEVCAYLANVYAWAGDLDRSCALSRQRAALARRTHDRFHLRDVHSWIAFQLMLQGNWAEAAAQLALQEQLLADLAGPEPHAVLHNYRGLLYYFLGRFADADQEYRTAAELLRPTGSPTRVWYLGWWGETLAELGRREEALACFAELHALADTLDARARARGNAYAQVAVGYARIGEQARAAACYAGLLPFQGQYSPVLIDRGLGIAAWAAQERAAAQRHMADAAAQARAARMRPELALILLQWARLARELPAAARAAQPDELLAEGLRLCADLGMEELGRRTRYPEGPGSRRGRTAAIAGLSVRELEVLRLVAQGQTNQQIAHTLVLSEKTVARHLTHIFTKTGVENRAGAAAFALRHGLA
jgi:DNA-binding CsgD family transcriptional regulator/tetratricopeptide (TPR) repeat protein